MNNKKSPKKCQFLFKNVLTVPLILIVLFNNVWLHKTRGITSLVVQIANINVSLLGLCMMHILIRWVPSDKWAMIRSGHQNILRFFALKQRTQSADEEKGRRIVIWHIFTNEKITISIMLALNLSFNLFPHRCCLAFGCKKV